MKIVIIGGNGTIGSRVSTYFKEGNEVIIAGRTSGDVTVDITDSNSIKAMFEQTGNVDAIVCMSYLGREYYRARRAGIYMGPPRSITGLSNAAS